jgi:hypothetical protein
MNYSDDRLTTLAQTNPKELARILINPNSDIRMLSLGVEILGEEVKDETIVLPVIKQLLKHINAIVREGAVIGASSFYMDKKPPRDILDRLKVMSNSDPSPLLKEFAGNVLVDFEALA